MNDIFQNRLLKRLITKTSKDDQTELLNGVNLSHKTIPELTKIK